MTLGSRHVRRSVLPLVPASLVVLLAVSTAPAWAQTPDGGAPDARPTAPAVDGGASAAAPGSPTAAPTAAVTGALQVVKVSFRGNRKVEDDALRVNLRTLPGASITQELVREDVRALWRMGFFEDIQVEATNVPGGVAIVFVLKEKPSIHKIFVSGHDEIGLTKVNEVLDLKKEQILDLAKVKKNMEKIREVYLQRGFYMADVTYELKRVNQSEVDITFRVHENSKVEVRRVNFVGNKAASDSDLRSVMFTQEADLLSFVTSAGTYREDVFQRDVAMLQAYYLDRGYVHAKISEPKFELSADKRSLFITIPIDEGVPYKLGKIDFQGDLIEDKAKILNRLRVKPGDTFNRSKLGQDIQELTEEYKDRGFAYVNIIPQTPIDEKTRIVDVVFEIQKGSEVTFERINIRGNTKTRDKVIRREMRVIEGERYSASGLELSKSRVTALGFFERVDFSEKRGQSDDKIEVNVEIAEKQTGAFQIGAGFSSAENFIFQAQISQNNLLGRGQSLSLQAMLSSLRQLFQLSFIEPYFLDTRWTFGFDLFNQFQYYPSFQRKTRGGSLTWGYMLVDNLHLYLRYTLEEVNISTSGRTAFLSGGQRTPFPAGTLANLLRPGLKSSVRLSISHDTRDNRLFTNRGWFNEASAELAEPILLSQTRFTRYDATSRYFYPLWGPFVLRLKGQFGLVTSRDPEGVPIFERYFVGGIYDVRGFRPYTLGPRIRAPDAQTPDSLLNDRTIGGNMQVVTKAEIEFPIIEKVGIRAVLFADAGNAYNLEDQYCSLRPSNPHSSVDPCVKLTKFGDINSLRASWGFGFRWFSPIGPLRFEWGLPFKPLANEEPMIFEFTIGNDL